MSNYDIRKILILTVTGTIAFIGLFMIRGFGPELVRYVRIRRM